MLTNRLSPLHLLQEVQNTFDLFDEITSGSRRALAGHAWPALNAWSDEQNFYLEAELPGMQLDELEIFVADRNRLTIKGSRKECSCEGGKYLARERGYGEFQRQIQLPGPVEEDQVEALLKNGVLTITLPKAPEIRPRRIEVKGS